MQKFLAVIVVGQAVICSPVMAETCALKSLDTSQQTRLVKVFDRDTNEIVFHGEVRGGQSITLTVSGRDAWYQYKYPENPDYGMGTGFSCKNGESTNF